MGGGVGGSNYAKNILNLQHASLTERLTTVE